MKTVLEGACKFCGQINHVEVEANCPEELIIEKATMNCGCNEGIKYATQTRGEKKINKLFAENYPEVVGILTAAIPEIMKGAIEKVTIDTGTDVKAIITTKKGLLNIKKEIKIKDDALIR